LRPEYGLPALRDIRLRRALAHTIDKQGLIDGLFEGQGGIADTFVGREHPFYSEIDRAVTKYAYDPLDAERLMNEAGFRKDRDGFFASGTGERLQPAFWITSGSQTERLLALLTDDWRRNGYDFQPYVIPIAQARDNQLRSTFPGLLNYGVSPSLSQAFETFISIQIGSAENRWSGQNRGGWANPQYDRTLDALHGTLDASERVQRMAEMAKLLSDDLPNYPLAVNLGAITHLSVLKGPSRGTRETTDYWNIQEWELQ
jgi:ABC-type transport system substrate-binding protein